MKYQSIIDINNPVKFDQIDYDLFEPQINEFLNLALDRDEILIIRSNPLFHIVAF